MTPFFQTGPEGITIHLPPLPSGLEAVLWLAGFGAALFILLTVLRAAPRLWRHLNAAPDHPGGLGAWLGWPRTIDSRTAPALGRVLGAGLLAVAAVTLAWLLVDFFAALARPEGHDDVRNIGLTIAALIGFPLLIWRAIVAQQQARTAQENLITSLINKAVEGLGAEKTVKEKGKEQTHPNIEVRIGAIYQLERIAHTQAHSGTDKGARDHIRIMEILCAYIRENAPAAKAVDLNLGAWPEPPEVPTPDTLREWEASHIERRDDLAERINRIREGHRPRSDIQTALTVLRRRDTRQIRMETEASGPGWDVGYPIDLIRACLQAANFRKGQFGAAYLSKARLEGAYLTEAQFERAHLDEARLDWAGLSGANLTDANLTKARLERANLKSARLDGANLGEARLQGADLTEAQVRGTNLSWADFRAAKWANVSGGGCPAHFADLRGAKNLAPSLLHALVGNAATLLPDHSPGLYIPHKWAKEPPGFDRLLDMLAGSGGDRREVRAQLLCASGEGPMKTGTPWPLNAPPPWGARAEGERDDAYRRRVIAWTAAQPLRGPVD